MASAAKAFRHGQLLCLVAMRRDRLGRKHVHHALVLRVTPNLPDRCFAPVVDAAARVLILGSLPGRRSLEAQRYYAHPQNQFWRLMGAVIGVDLIALDYAPRLSLLRNHGIGLWDTVAEAQRPGSLDSALRDIAANDLATLVEGLPVLSLIAFNGQKAAAIGMRQLPDRPGAPAVILPSSSPAYTLPFERKLESWRSHLEPALGRA